MLEGLIKKTNGQLLQSKLTIANLRSREHLNNAGKNTTIISSLDRKHSIPIGQNLKIKYYLMSIKTRAQNGKLFHKAFHQSNFDSIQVTKLNKK